VANVGGVASETVKSVEGPVSAALRQLEDRTATGRTRSVDGPAKEIRAVEISGGVKHQSSEREVTIAASGEGVKSYFRLRRRQGREADCQGKGRY
jgi:hypothetical protein